MKKLNFKNFNSNTVYTIMVYTLAIVAALLWLYPLVYVVSASFSDPNALLNGEVVLLPKGFNFNAYKYIFQNDQILVGYGNTIFYSVVGTLYNMVLTICAAYPLSRSDLKGRNLLTVMITFTMFFGGGMIPTYLNLNSLHMLNPRWVMFVPAAISATNFIIMRNYFTHSVPGELIESAHIEGASQLQILSKIVLPLSKPIMAVLGLYIALGAWNNWYSYMIYLPTKDELHPLQYFLVKTLIQAQSAAGGLGMTMEQTMQSLQLSYIMPQLKYAMIVVAVVPIMCVYPFVQKYFVKGVMLGSLKE